MSTTTVTRADLVAAESQALGLRRRDCANLLEDTLEVIANRLAAGEGVAIMNFGAFSTRRAGARLGRNPRTGEPVPIAARRIVRFRPARRLRHYSNHPEDVPRRPKRQLELFEPRDPGPEGIGSMGCGNSRR